MSIEIKEGLILKSADGEFVYNIYSLSKEQDLVIVDILNSRLETITTRRWTINVLQDQIDRGTIIEFKPDEMIGMVDEK